VNNLRWERRLGVSTRGRLAAAAPKPDAVHYATIDYPIIHRTIGRLSLQPADVFVDVGCGRGRVLCCAARHVCQKVIGIEYSDEFCVTAHANARQMRGKQTPIVVQKGIAEEFDYSDATVLYFFCPFGPATLDVVLNKIRKDNSTHRLRMAFVNLSANHDEVFANHAWLTTYDRWETEAGVIKFFRRPE
jgi:precorrin-6B methylase 2